MLPQKTQCSGKFLPCFLMGNFPAPMKMPSQPGPSLLGGGSTQPPSPKKRSGAPPVGTIYDHIFPKIKTSHVTSRKLMKVKTTSKMPCASSIPIRKYKMSVKTLSPYLLRPFYTPEDPMYGYKGPGDTWITVSGFCKYSASRLLKMFGNIGKLMKHVMLNHENIMYLKCSTKEEAEKAQRQNGNIFCPFLKLRVESSNESIMPEEELVLLQDPTEKDHDRILSVRPTRPGRVILKALRAATRSFQNIENIKYPASEAYKWLRRSMRSGINRQ